MDIRLALYDLAAEHHLDAQASRRLQSLAALDAEPASLKRVLPLGVAALAAVLIGLGLIFWIAANWDSLGRFGRFALLQSVIVVMVLGALARAAWRAPLAVLVLLATGALFAYFGQTYQTGADPWQLFALWAALMLPLAIGVRSDLVWAPWALVVFVAITLWVHAHSGHGWFNSVSNQADLVVHLVAWACAGVVVALTSGIASRFTGAGIWSLRTAITLAVVLVSSIALIGLFSKQVDLQYPLGLLALSLLAASFVPARRFDVYALSATALGLVTLAVAGIGRFLFDGARGDPIGNFFMLGLAAAGLLAGAVSLVLHLARTHASREGAALAQADVARAAS